MRKTFALANDIYIGSVTNPLYHFTIDNTVKDNNKGVFALDVIGNELSVDQFSVVVRPDDNVTDIKNFMREIPYGTPVWWYVDGDFFSKGYLKSVDRVSKYGFKLTATSGVGLLDTTMHPGGLYQAAAIADVLASIIGTAFAYEISENLITTRVYGRLPYDTRRNNLHRLLFATGAALLKSDSETDYEIAYLSEDITDIPASRVAMQGSVNYQLPSNKAEITEHAFFKTANDPVVTLFDNTSETPANNLTIVFDGPAYDFATTGTMTIAESGVNYAIVNGLGTLTGKYYVHTTQITSLVNNPNNDPERVRRVTDNELVTALNARNVARRVLSYYQSAKTVKAKILLDGERCGQQIRMTDSFGELTQAYLAKMDALVTSVIGAQCQLIEGFQPGANGNFFLHRMVVDAAWIAEHGNTLTWLEEETFVRIALIGGGDGGQGGYDGEEGAYKYKGTDPIWDPGEPGGEITLRRSIWDDYQGTMTVAYENQQRVPAGGNPGNPGQQAKVYVIEQNLTHGEVLTFTLGVGGSGGARNGGSGAAGTATTVSSTSIGSASSEDGLASQGYFDPMTGEAMATQGISGYKGGSGGRTDTVNLNGYQGGSGLLGESVAGFSGGQGGVGQSSDFNAGYYGVIHCTASGGGGGGSAYGANGSPGGAAVATQDGSRTVLTSGAGGDGANALPLPKGTYGTGGAGGNGGGAGGNCGGVYGYISNYFNAVFYKHVGGASGHGSVGGDGGDGVAIIYW